MRYVDLLVEIGMGIDLMGGDVHESIRRAINDIVHRVCIPFFREKGVSVEDTEIVVEVYTPYPDRVEEERIKGLLPLKPGRLKIEVYKGGARSRGLEEILVSIVVLRIRIPE